MIDKRKFLDMLYYDVGKQQYNFELCFLGNETASKWRKFLDCIDDKNFIDKANNRSIFPNEIVLDIENPEEFKEILEEVKQEFKSYQAYKTGSRGYHIHLWFNKEISSDDKLKIITKFRGDKQKSISRCLIALENCPHWKTGNPKELIEEEKGINIFKEIKAEGISKVIREFFDKRDLARKVLEVQPFYYDENKFWWFWDYENTCWKITDETDILNIIGNVSTANTINSKDKTEILEALRQEARKNKPKPIKKEWIQFKGEIFDIKTGEQFKATPKYFAVNPIAWELDKDCFEETPTIDKIFTEWVGEKYVKTLYEILAYCLIPDYPIQRYFILNGGGNNGKSCYLNLLTKFLGEQNVSASELEILLNSRFEAVKKLWKKLACVMGETNFNEIKNTSILKKATGNDRMGFEDKYKGSFEDRNYAKIIIATNNIPETADKTDAFYKRCFVIDFNNKFSEKIDILATIPEEEYKSLALKCCSILNDLLKKREFTNEGTIEDRQKRYEDKSNPMALFIKEFCNTNNPNGFIFTFEFEKRFSAWCKENRCRIFSEHSIGKKLRELGMENGREYANFGNHNQIRCWRGIEWKKTKQDT